MTDAAIIYEQPVTELARACLRLEHGFEQTTHYRVKPSDWSSRSAITSINEIINLLDRPDLRSKLTTEFQRYAESLQRLQRFQHVDSIRLQEVLGQVEEVMQMLHGSSGKFAQALREHKFLEHVRLYAQAGACNFDTPALHAWLAQPADIRNQRLAEWYKEFHDIEKAVRLLLKLVRESSTFRARQAEQGFYEESLDAQSACQLVQVQLAGETCYPEISAGRHRLCARFLQLQENGRAMQVSYKVEFQLKCCMVLARD